MSTEEEFAKWLRRADKTFLENLKFAIKSWQSIELTLASKYEIILKWLVGHPTVQEEDLSGDFSELLKLRAQPGLIEVELKEEFIQWMLRHARAYDNSTRKWSELLLLLLAFEPLQDLFRKNYKLHVEVFGAIFSCYEKYLENMAKQDMQVLSTNETEFLASVINSLKDTVKRCGDVNLYLKNYTSFALNDLVKLLTLLKGFKVDFFDDFVEIERMLCTYMPDSGLMSRIMQAPLHVRLPVLECAIVNRRGVDTFMEMLIGKMFTFAVDDDLPVDLRLSSAAYTMEMLRRHDISLAFNIGDQSVSRFFGEQVVMAAESWKGTHLKPLLMLLCAVLRYNPLILEESIFKVTVWIMLASKSGDIEERLLFEEYLILLMDMFRRLSRAEKFVGNLLKAVNENAKHTFPLKNKKRKQSEALEGEPPKKKADNLEQDEVNVEQISIRHLSLLFEHVCKPVLSQNKAKECDSLSASAAFPKLQNFWPSNPVGVAFSKIIMGLVSKPSLVIWKTLLFSLKSCIEKLQEKTELHEKHFFLLDFHVALLAQYCAGCKLAQQFEKFFADINTQRQFTAEVLQQLGKFIISREYNSRTMSAFLELSYYATSLDLTLAYYRPDGCTDEMLSTANVAKTLLGFLSDEEWSLLQQRVLNFGKSSCKCLWERLMLQKIQASLLLISTGEGAHKIRASFHTDDSETLQLMLSDPSAKYMVSKMKVSEKILIAPTIAANENLLHLAFDDLQMLELVSLVVYENMSSALRSKNSLLKALSPTIARMRESLETSSCETLIKEVIEDIKGRAETEHKVKKIDRESLQNNIGLLSKLPIGHLRRQRKTLLVALTLALYHDLKSAQEEDLASLAFEMVKDLLHFGQQVQIFKYFTTADLIKLLPVENCWDLYEILFSTVKREEKGTDQFLTGLATILEHSVNEKSLADDERKLLLAAIDTLASLNGPCAKRMRTHLEKFLDIFSNYLSGHFEKSNDSNFKKDKKFVQNTLAGFAPYASVRLAKASKGKENKEIVEDLNIDENFRRINKIYIGHSMDYHNPHAIRLMQVALNYRELLHLDQDEIELVLTNYWTQIKEDLSKKEQSALFSKTMESAIKMIIGNKTNEDLLITLKSVAKSQEGESVSSILKLLNLIAKCPFSTIKGAIFNEQYKQIVFNIALKLPRDGQQHFVNNDVVVSLLNCHQTVIDNKMIPVTGDTIDSVLTFLMEINMKRFSVGDTNLDVFTSLHAGTTAVCASLIKHRHLLLMDRIPQYMLLFKDLVQAIVWYKSDRQKDTALPEKELEALADLAMKLEAVMNLIGQYGVVVKRIAPFVLTYIINMMVSNRRPTTLYSKIKTHIENICYVLIGICDHRVGRFILRCSSEAARQLYELLVKDHQKYHKFKGKV